MSVKKTVRKFFKSSIVCAYNMLFAVLPVDKKCIVFDSSIGLN